MIQIEVFALEPIFISSNNNYFLSMPNKTLKTEVVLQY